MDDGRFDAMIRVLGSEAPRRRVLAGLLASVPLGLGKNAAAKKKCKKGKKKCGKKCIPKSNCCTSATCGPNQTCTKGKCTCQQGFICAGAVPWCNAQHTCACTAVLEGGAVCAGGLCDDEEICDSTAFCVEKFGPGFICQAPGTGCCGQKCVVPCGFVPEESERARAGATGDGQGSFGSNIGGGGSGKDR